MNKHGNCAVREHLDRYASEQHRRYPASPMRCHNDEIAAPCFGRFDDCRVEMLMLDVDGFKRHVTRFRYGCTCSEILLRLSM